MNDSIQNLMKAVSVHCWDSDNECRNISGKQVLYTEKVFFVYELSGIKSDESSSMR